MASPIRTDAARRDTQAQAGGSAISGETSDQAGDHQPRLVSPPPTTMLGELIPDRNRSLEADRNYRMLRNPDRLITPILSCSRDFINGAGAIISMLVSINNLALCIWQLTAHCDIGATDEGQ